LGGLDRLNQGHEQIAPPVVGEFLLDDGRIGRAVVKVCRDLLPGAPSQLLGKNRYLLDGRWVGLDQVILVWLWRDGEPIRDV
jgi:hypothetical protein